jgi:molybdopterin-binding protein
LLSVKNISISLGELDIRDISFDVKSGEYFVLLGASGVGKSVLLEAIAGLREPDKGKVFIDGEDVTSEKIQRRKIGMVFQTGALFPHMTVYDNIAYPLRCRRLSKHQIRKRVNELAEDFAVAGFLGRRPGTLSGGETQRVSLARAVASEPKCLLLDEPISSLDVKLRPEIRSLLRKINMEGQTVVHVTHDYTEAVSLGTHIAVMEKGQIAQLGTVEEVFQHPKSEFVARFVGIRNFFKGRLEDSAEAQKGTRRFTTDGLTFSVLTDSPAGAGYIMVRSEDVTIYNAPIETSARNNFRGKIEEIIPAGAGIEVIVDIGGVEPVEVAAIITRESVKNLDLRCDKEVWISFKASAVRYVEQ